MVLKYIKYIVFVVLVLCLVGPGSAADYYVKNGGNNSADGLSDATAWETVGKVNGFSFSTGDDVYFKCDSTWDMDATNTDILGIDWNGTSENRVIIGSYYGDGIIGVSGVKPIIDGGVHNTSVLPERPSGGTYFGLVHVGYRNYITVQNISIKDSRGCGVYCDHSNYVIVENCDVDWIRASGIIFNTYSSNGQVIGCTVHNVGIGSKYFNDSDWGFGVGGVNSCLNTTIKNCLVYECWTEGIGLYKIADNSVIENNIVYDAQKGAIYLDAAKNNIIRYNFIYGTTNSLFHRTANFVGSGLGVTDELHVPARSENNSFYGNMVANTYKGIAIGANNHDFENSEVYNNVFVDNNIGISYYVIPSGSSTNSFIKNNIIWQPSADSQHDVSASTPGLTWSHNLWGSDPGAYVTGTGDVIGLPLLEKTTDWQNMTAGTIFGSNFTLQSSSPAIDNGTNLGSPYDVGLNSVSVWPDSISYFNHSIYGSGWEIGAFVYSVAAGSAPNITSWQNDKTSNNTLDFTINISEEVNFNATANQTITTWNWYKDDVDQSHNYNNVSLNWTTTGLKHVIVNATNTNGTSSSITWNVTVESTVNTSYFTYHKIIAINDTMVAPGIGTGIYPLLVSTTDTDLANSSQADGDDIVFFASDNTTLLPYEQELWNSTTGELAEWVGVTDITNVTYIVLWYNNSTVANSENATGVWDSNFKLVQHLNEISAGTTYDSTSNNNDGTTVNMTSADQVSGQVDGSLELDGDDHISLTSLAANNNSAFTISTWMNGTDGDIAYGEGYDGDTAWALFLGIDGSSPYSARFYIKENNVWKALTVGTTQVNDSYHYVTLSQTNKSYRTIYIDGQPEETTTTTYGDMSTLNTANIGVLERSTFGSYFVGGLDELRVSDTARSAAWIETEYNNTASPELFISIGAEQGGAVEDYTPPNPTSLSNTTGNFWVNYTWSAGSGNVTDSYNVSYNSSWDNTSSNTYRNESVGAHGYLDIMVYAYNSSGAGTLSASSLTDNVTVPNNAISISNISASYTLNEGETLYIDADATDADSDTPTFDDNSTNWNVNSGTGIVSWVTADGDDGTYNYYINVTDGYGSTDTQAFTVTVNNSTYPPTITRFSVTPDTINTNYTGTITISYLVSSSDPLNLSSLAYLYGVNYTIPAGGDMHSYISAPPNDIAYDGIYRAPHRNLTPHLSWEDNATITGGNVWQWGGYDNDSTEVSTSVINATHTWINVTGVTEDILPSSFYLSKTAMYDAPKTGFEVSRNQALILKMWNLEEIRNRDADYLANMYFDTSWESTEPTYPIEIGYCTDSYDPATDDIDVSPYCAKFGEWNGTRWINHSWNPSANASYASPLTVNASDFTDPVPTDTNYVWLRSNTISSKSYVLNATNYNPGITNITFDQTETMWTYNELNGVTDAVAYTPSYFTTYARDDEELLHHLYISDDTGEWGHSEIFSEAIGVSSVPISAVSFEHFNVSCGDEYVNDTLMDANYDDGNIDIHIHFPADPDGGDATHNITLHHAANETFIAVINDSITTTGDEYLDISFSTTPYYSGTNYYTLKCVSTDDEGSVATKWLVSDFTLDADGNQGWVTDDVVQFWGMNDIPTLYTTISNNSLISYNAGDDAYTMHKPFFKAKCNDTFNFNETVYLKSLNDEDVAYFRFWGSVVFDNATIIAWNTTLDSPAPITDTYRGYVYTYFHAKGNITNSNFSYLGSNLYRQEGLNFVEITDDYLIHNTTFSNNAEGLIMEDCTEFTISNSTISDNVNVGVGVYFTDSITIENCTITSNGGRGVSIYEGNDNTIRYNDISDSGTHGIHAWSNSDNNTFTGNTISSSTLYDYYFTSSTTNNSIVDPASTANKIRATSTSEVNIENTDNAAFSEDSTNTSYAYLTNFSMYVTGVSQTFDITQTSMIVTPSTDELSIWNIDQTGKFSFNVSSDTANNPTWFNITNTSWANQNISVYRNGTIYANETVDATGFMDFNYTGEYSEKWFEFILGDITNYNNFSFTNISVSPVNVLQGDTSTVSIDISDFDGTINTAIVKIRDINYTMTNTVDDTWSYTYSNSYVGKHYITDFYAQDNNLDWNSTTSLLYINILDSSGGGGGAPGSSIPTATPTVTPTVPPSEEPKDDNLTIPDVFKIIAGEGLSMFKINIGVDDPVYSKTIKYGDIESCTVLDGDFVACNASNGKVRVIVKPQLKGVFNYYTSYVQLLDNNETVHDIPIKIIVLDLMGWVQIPNIHVNSLPNILFEKEPITNDVIGMRLWWVFGLMGIGLYRYAKT